jgi:2-iminoacetate synthase
MNSRVPSFISLRHITQDDLGRILASDDRGFLEDLAAEAREVTRQYFGRAIGLYAPLYISNYCRNRCAYCGFQAKIKIPRKKLSMAEIEEECRALAAKGIQSCLILTGESRYHSPPSYIREAVAIAGRHFAGVSLEVYPLETEEYRELYLSGADGVTLFQETYDRVRYDELHLAGPKKNYDYRVAAPERMAKAGIRQISMGVLLGLADWHQDVPALFGHLRYLERNYPGVEYTLSFPRIRPVEGDERKYFDVTDKDMLKIMCVARLLFRRVGINISTREDARFRDNVIQFGVTKMSAGSLTTVGGYGQSDGEAPREGQFQVHDQRSLAEIKLMLESKGFDPVITDWRNIVNQ